MILGVMLLMILLVILMAELKSMLLMFCEDVLQAFLIASDLEMIRQASPQGLLRPPSELTTLAP